MALLRSPPGLAFYRSINPPPTESNLRGDPVALALASSPCHKPWPFLPLAVVEDFVSRDPYVKGGLVPSHKIRRWRIDHHNPNFFAPAGDAPTPLLSRISSMSGFSRVDGRHRNKLWSWEVHLKPSSGSCDFLYVSNAACQTAHVRKVCPCLSNLGAVGVEWCRSNTVQSQILKRAGHFHPGNSRPSSLNSLKLSRTL